MYVHVSRSLPRAAYSTTSHKLVRPRAILIDGNSILYGSYYGTPPLHSKYDGTNVNAVYTMLRTIMKHVSSVKHAAVCWDRPEPTFRHHLMSSYKAQRSPAPDDLRPQFELAKEAVSSLGIAQFEQIGFEADDLLASITHKLHQKHGYDVRLISADKDLLQLVRPSGSDGEYSFGSVDLAHPFSKKKGVQSHDDVILNWGVEPKQLPSLFAMMGDSADNVKGIAGIGKKIGAKLLQDYETLEGVLEAAKSDRPPKGNNARGLNLIRKYITAMNEKDSNSNKDGECFGNYLKSRGEGDELTPIEYLHLLESMHRMRTDVENLLLDSDVSKQLKVSTEFSNLKYFLKKHGFQSIDPVGDVNIVVEAKGTEEKAQKQEDAILLH